MDAANQHVKILYDSREEYFEKCDRLTRELAAQKSLYSMVLHDNTAILKSALSVGCVEIEICSGCGEPTATSNCDCPCGTSKHLQNHRAEVAERKLAEAESKRDYFRVVSETQMDLRDEAEKALVEARVALRTARDTIEELYASLKGRADGELEPGPRPTMSWEEYGQSPEILEIDAALGQVEGGGE
jgi:hypothetical protein